MATELTVDVYYDIICPWCLIGKRHLARAQALLVKVEPDVALRVRWHPVQLLTDLPPEGLPFADFYVHRLGSPQAVSARQAQVNAVAADAGLHIDFSRIARMPNTTQALRLLAHASAHGTAQQQDSVVERLFAAHFLQGRNIGETATLLAIAHDCGLQGPDVQASLELNSATTPPEARSTAGQGVPYFIFNNQFSLAGAHPPQVLLQAMRKTLANSGAPVGNPA